MFSTVKTHNLFILSMGCLWSKHIKINHKPFIYKKKTLLEVQCELLKKGLVGRYQHITKPKSYFIEKILDGENNGK